LAKPLAAAELFIDYNFSLSLLDQLKSYKIKKDQVIIKFQLLTVEQPKDDRYPDRWKLIEGKNVETVKPLKDEIMEIKVQLIDANQRPFFDKDIENGDEDIVSWVNIWVQSLKSGKLLLESLGDIVLLFFKLEIPIYNFEPKSIKGGSSIKGKAELDYNGSNLSLILKDILNNMNQRKILKDLLTDILPFVEDLKIDEYPNNTVFEIKEKYSLDNFFPSLFISDGTANIIAILVALFLQYNHSLTVIEEPDRNMHPRLISNIVSYMKQASEYKQLIITTHNPELIRHTDADNIFLVGRKENGFSTIVKPVEKEEIQQFLQNDLGIADLHIQDLLNVK
jgi:hypothetical protein